MAEYPLSQTVDRSQRDESVRGAFVSVLTSTLVQGLAIAALIVAPLLSGQTMPEPVSALSLPPIVPVHIDPPAGSAHHGPETAVRPSSPWESRYRPTLLSDAFVPPPTIPDGIPEGENRPPGSPFGIEGGLPPELGGVPRKSSETDNVADASAIRIVGDVRPPRKIVHVSPVYPRAALNARISGTVKLQAIIDADGRVVDLLVVESVVLLDDAAIDAVRQWRYQPTYLNGRAVPVIMTVSVTFQLA